MHCPACSTDNPSVANYCFNCGKNFPYYSPSTSDSGIPLEVLSIDSWGYKIVKRWPFSYWFSLILIWQVILAIDYFIASYYGEDYNLIFHFLLYTSWGLAAAVVEFCNREMKNFFPRLKTFVDEPEEKVKLWYAKSLRRSYANKWSLLFCILIAIIGPISTASMLATITESELLLWFRIFVAAIGFFFIASGIWAIFSIIIMIVKLSGFNIRVNLIAVGNDSLMSLGNLFLRMSAALSFVYLFIVAADITGGFIESKIVLVWNGIAVICILSFFMVPQIKIHKLIRHEKQERIRSFSRYLEEEMNLCLKEPSIEKMKHLRELFELKSHLSQMHEWSFRAGTLSQLISILIIPTLLVLLEVFLSN